MSLELNLGRTPSGIPIILRNPENPHVSISGRSGSGKSFLLRQLIEQAVQQRALCIVLDYTSDFTDYTTDGIPIQRIDVTSPAFTMNPLVRADGQSLDQCVQQLLCLLHSVFRMGPRATMGLRDTCKKYLQIGGIPTIKGLLEYATGVKKSGTGLAAALDPLALLASQIHSGPVPISLNLTTPGLVILDFCQIIDVDLKKFVVELLLQAVWTQRTTRPLLGMPPLVLILDECQNLAWGQNSMSIRILREGRKYDIAGWFASQWINRTEAIAALGQAALQAHFRPDDQNVRQLARRLCPTGGSALARYQTLIQSLRRGQFLYQAPSGRVLKVLVPAQI